MDVRNSFEEAGVFWEGYRQIQGDVAQNIQITFHLSSSRIAIADLLKTN